jgi:hypothetical protein
MSAEQIIKVAEDFLQALASQMTLLYKTESTFRTCAFLV